MRSLHLMVFYTQQSRSQYLQYRMGKLAQTTAEIQRILNEADKMIEDLATPDTDSDVEEVWNNIINS